MPNKVVNLYTFGNYWISTGFNQLLFRASKFNNDQCFRHYSTPSVQSNANGSDEQANDKSPYSKYVSWTDADELAHHLSQSIVAINKYFVVIDKPPNLSVWGHSLTSREAISVINPKLVNTSDLGIYDCLPQLSNIISSLEKEQHHNFNNDLSNSCTTVEVPKLDIIEALPAAYSGLILLGRNEKYTNAARKFYKSATLGGTPWELYQKLLIVCWGKPQKKDSTPASFPIASYRINDHLRVGFRPSPNEISGSLKKNGVILRKSVQHTVLSEGYGNCSLLKLETNSTFRGLPEVYLLYEGCTVVGETFQASRLVDTGLSPVVLPPSKIRLNYSMPLKQRQILGHSNADNLDYIPVHIHRSHLYLPIPYFINSSNLCIGSYVKKPSFVFKNKFTVFSINDCSVSSKPSSLALSCVKCVANSDTTTTTATTIPTKNSDRLTNYYFLTCHSPELPNYFRNTLNRLGIEFDYANWLKQNIVNNHKNDKTINKIA